MKTEVIRLKEGREDVTLTTYVLQDSPDLLAGKSRPAILICPGGGYFNCSDREAEPIALRFAGMGYHCFVLRYSTYCRGEGFFPDLSTQYIRAVPSEHYRFAGWNTRPDGSGKQYSDLAIVKNLTALNGATVTLYAQWKRK